ncbi:MAG: DUF305 domain-containing protein [Devosia nanyangense]|uniref:DUF305 domain-containing protein n=1 Tax=Devosia nanyangense TaxID=1228055 RepID=A0A933L1A9_9HYPH|nr:DUF305 domain-containing protein [Devosia nanyangense]
MTRSLIVFAAALLLAAPATAAELPPICLVNAGMADMAGGGGMAMGSPDQAHQDLMAGMDAMNKDMNAGATATDLDVAFICSMIPHHQGAIDMAKAELAHGDDPWAKELAENIIAAQEKEIAEMLDWLGKQPK